MSLRVGSKKHPKKHPIIRRVSSFLASLLGPALFLGAVWILFTEVHKVGFYEIFTRLRNLPPRQIGLSLGSTLLCYSLLTGYDVFSLRSIHVSISYPKILFTSFLSNAFNNTIGMSNLAGTLVRYRIYSEWGVPNRSIFEMIAIYFLSNWFGFLTVAGVVFLFIPPDVKLSRSYLFFSVITEHLNLFGMFCLLAALGTLLWVGILPWRGRKPISIVLGLLKMKLQSNLSFLALLCTGCLDFSITGIPLYCLLPEIPALSYFQYLGIFLLAQIVGIVSHIPGGLGVFEAMLLISLESRYSHADLLSALIAYRILYYWLPVGLASIFILIFEIRHRRKKKSFEDKIK